MAQTAWYSRAVVLIGVGASMALVAGRLDADPPARVGRLNYLNGSVSLRPASSDEWTAAVPNRPLTTGDRIWTDNDSRAELHVGSTAIRMDAQTEIDLTVLDDNVLQLRLAQGSMNIVVRHLDEGQSYEIDTPNGAVSIGRTGEYRIDVNADGTTSMVTVWSGSAEVSSAGSSFVVNSRQLASVNGTDSPTYNLVDAPAYDSWDQWCVSRDQREANSQSARYVSTEMTGYEDLDAYGRWQTVPGYGPVWYPAAQPAGWAPYHTGHWVWVDPWGWTWVDDAPWGYAPYHYGRWVYAGGYWGWVPGQMAPRPVYAPALVAFVGAPAPRPGFSAGVAVGIGGTVAWFALGPQEVYRPAYAVSPTYVRQVNVTNVTNVTNITTVTNTTNVTNVQYRNREVPGAMMATTTTTFAGARPVQSAPVQVTRELRSAPVMGAAPAVAPTRASLAPAYSGRVLASAPPASLEHRSVTAKMTPPPPPIPFAARQQALAANNGRPLDPAQDAAIRQHHATLASAGPALVRPAAQVPPSGGLKRASSAYPVHSVAAQPSPRAAVPMSTDAAHEQTGAAHNTVHTSVHTDVATSPNVASHPNGSVPQVTHPSTGQANVNVQQVNKQSSNQSNKQSNSQSNKSKNTDKAHPAPQHEHSEKAAKAA